jgi:precorrin-6x reductase
MIGMGFPTWKAPLPPCRIGARVFLAIGKQNLDLFAGKPDNFYLLRLVDAPSAALPLPDAVAVIDRGPFSEAGDLASCAIMRSPMS